MPARSLRKPKSDEAGTRERILSAAAPLFAANGFEATGVRAIAAEAGVNIAAVNYHFGSKDALIAAVGEHQVNSVNERRIDALAAAIAAAPGGKVSVEAVIESFVVPSIRHLADCNSSNFILMRLIHNRIKNDPENTGKLIREAMVPVLNKFVDALAVALPGTTRTTLHQALHLVVGAYLHSVTCTEMLQQVCPGVPCDPESLIRRLVNFGAAGVRAVSVKQ